MLADQGRISDTNRGCSEALVQSVQLAHDDVSYDRCVYPGYSNVFARIGPLDGYVRKKPLYKQGGFVGCLEAVVGTLRCTIKVHDEAGPAEDVARELTRVLARLDRFIEEAAQCARVLVLCHVEASEKSERVLLLSEGLRVLAALLRLLLEGLKLLRNAVELRRDRIEAVLKALTAHPRPRVYEDAPVLRLASGGCVAKMPAWLPRSFAPRWGARSCRCPPRRATNSFAPAMPAHSRQRRRRGTARKRLGLGLNADSGR